LLNVLLSLFEAIPSRAARRIAPFLQAENGTIAFTGD
jgi:hypothetical protein